MPLSEAVVVHNGRGVTSRIRSLSPAAISLHSGIAATPGEAVTVFLDGLGKLESRVTFANPPRLDLAFLTDTQERWRQLHALRRLLPG